MKYMRFIFLFIAILFCLEGCAQKMRSRIGRAAAQQELNALLKDTSFVGPSTLQERIISDSASAIKLAEPILFSAYGKKNIVQQRPYEVYSIDKYWLVMGTLPYGWDGGVFLIVLNAKNGRIINMTHGK